MPEPRAFLVEDDPEQAAVSSAILREAGFHVDEFVDFESAALRLNSDAGDVDLFVLDRRIPVRQGETEVDEVGDELLALVRESHPDARIIVFTGHASVPQMQVAMAGGGQLPGRGSAIDRITVLEKHQSIEFKEFVIEFRALLQELQDIEVIANVKASLSAKERRTLQRIAFEYGGLSVEARPLSGGLTGARVWVCDVKRAEGRIALVVAKEVEKSFEQGGLQDVIANRNAASTVATIAGLTYGARINIMRIAGVDPAPLMTLLAADPDAACAQAAILFAVLESVDERPQTLPIEIVASAFGPWETSQERLANFGVPPVAGTLKASTRVGMRHGDLHAANVLIVDGVPVLIDFDDSGYGSGLIDPLTLFLSTLVHPDSPIRGSGWPTKEEITDKFGNADFGSSHHASSWFSLVWAWILKRKSSDRELWSCVLAYCGRQLKYQDVRDDPEVLDRVIALANRASAELSATA